ncbi:MAG: chemotaxis protein CheB [Desulfobacterales bacterium]|nr:chemotaxis protein CheB [Desulfobacterales bacterium]MDD4071386.1 chemotaxis protein CheB [Desulfobacterales bacterium]MDD4391431.1 chemotaxis protein CheB [Desulfobacterales bacterium]
MRLARDSRGYFIRIDPSPPRLHQRPSIDILFHSVTTHADKQDSADGLLAMRKAGAAYTIAQDKGSCVVFGMPKEAIKRGPPPIRLHRNPSRG